MQPALSRIPVCKWVRSAIGPTRTADFARKLPVDDIFLAVMVLRHEQRTTLIGSILLAVPLPSRNEWQPCH